MKQLYPFVALAVMLAGGYFFFTQFKIDRDGQVIRRDPNDPLVPGAKSGTGGGLSDAVSKIGDSIRDAIDPNHLHTRDSTGASTTRRTGSSGARQLDPRANPDTRPRDSRLAGSRSSAGAYRDERDYPNSRTSDPRARASSPRAAPYDSRPYDEDPRYADRRAADPRYADSRYEDPRSNRASTAAYRGGTATPRDGAGQTIRIATFNIQVFGEKKLENQQVAALLASIIQHFDVVAIQEVRTQRQDFLPRFLEFVNQSGRRYRDVLGPREGRTSSKEQYAFLYDTNTVVCDENAVYHIDDPDDLLQRPPLVAAFACRQAPTDQAFTFTLINAHTQPDHAKEECDVLDDVVRAVRNDGRGEDDVLLMGDFNASPREMRHLSMAQNNGFVITNKPTNTRRSKIYDNIIFDRLATTEITANGGVFDFLRQYNLNVEQALEVSDHMPVWAEFSIYESGDSHRVARVPW